MDNPTTVSEARIAVSKNINDILKKIYQNINNDKFDLNLDLSEFSPNTLKDFWLYTSGFLFVQNFETILQDMPSYELNDILNGHFELKELSNEEADKILKDANIKRKKSGFNYVQDIETIQDGTYSINFNKSVIRDGRRKLANILVLDTDEVTAHFKNDITQLTEEQAIKIIRNVMVHYVPFIDGNTLFLLNNEGNVNFEISKMWLRGFSETFTRKYNPLSSEKIENELLKNFNKTKKNIKNENDIDEALSYIFNYFDESIKQNFFRVNNFVKLRTKYMDNFFDKSIEEKCKIIADIISKNPNFLKSSRETINPEILYDIQQLTSVELEKRGNDDIYVDNNDEITLQTKELLNRVEFLEKEISKIDPNSLKNARSPEFKRTTQLIQELDLCKFKLQNISPKIKDRYKRETTNMNFFDEKGVRSLENLPVEVSVNLVCLMGYNSLVTSSFYEDLLACTDFTHLSREQKIFFSKFDLSGVKTNYLRKVEPKNYSPADKATILFYLRNAISHGQIKFSLPPVKASQKVDFKNVLVEFTAGFNNVEIKATVQSLYHLFSSSPFSWDRSKNIITGKIEQYRENADENSSDLDNNTKDENQPE